jgi:probable DNA repair protein
LDDSLNKAVFESLRAGGTVVTANKRLSLYLAAQYVEKQLAAGHEVWEAVDILPWTSWVERQFFSLDSASRLTLLNSNQEQFVWEQIISRSESGANLMQQAATARLARKAWQMVQQWRLPSINELAATNGEASAFAEWAGHFQHFCRENHFIDITVLVDQLIESILNRKANKLPSEVWLAGFDEFLPQQELLFEALKKQSCRVNILPFPALDSEVKVHPCVDSNEEIILAAQWAKKRLEANHRVKIAIVLPDPARYRDELVRLFNEVFYPSFLLPNNRPEATVFNLSIGQPLPDYPLVATALCLLGFLKGKLPIDEIGHLLRSPFLASSEQELSARALLDRQLRQNGELSISLKRFIQLSKSRCSILSEMLEQFSKKIAELPTRASPSDWVNHFFALLGLLGWPGERSLDSEEYQTVEAFKGLMQSVALLDRVHSNMDRESVLGQLRLIAGETLFQSESKAAPIQIMGPLEVAGESFDHLWVMGLHDAVWPPVAHPNPFIPSSIQRAHEVSHSSAEREYHYIEKVTKRLLGAAKEVCISYPQREGELALRASPFLLAYPELQLTVDKNFYRHLLFGSGLLEEVVDNKSPSLKEGAFIKGGASHFKAQAACPFQAFARYRLAARELKEAEAGLDAMERGSLIHLALEKLWEVLQSQEQLLGLESDTLEEVVSKAAKEAVSCFEQRQPAQFPANFCVIEQKRIKNLLLEWLKEEKIREQFRVLAVEKSRQITVGSVKLDVVVDRIDQLADGSVAIIDYKTGKPKVADWDGERPNEPQLPLYGVYADENASELLFAQVRKSDMRYLGLSCQIEPNKGIKQPDKETGNWDGQLKRWHDSLENLAKEISEGVATVSPKKADESCQYCKLTSFCRIREQV